MNETETEAKWNFETSMSQKENDYFFAIYELVPPRLAVVILSLLLTLLLVPCLASIVWEDWFNPGPKRIFTSRIFSSLALNGIGYLIFVVVPDILRYLIGPYGERFCFYHYLAKSAFAMQQLLLADAMFFIRYVFIFWLKNPSAFDDKFWIYFTNMAVLGFSVITQLSFVLLPGRQPMISYFCSGKNPNEDQYQKRKINIIMVFFQVGTFILLLFINIKIRWFNRNCKHQPKDINIKKTAWKNKAYGNLMFNAGVLFVVGEATFVISKINFSNPAELNIYPNSMYVNVFQLINPLAVCAVLPIIYVWRNPNMKIISNGRLQRFYTCKS